MNWTTTRAEDRDERRGIWTRVERTAHPRGAGEWTWEVRRLAPRCPFEASVLLRRGDAAGEHEAKAAAKRWIERNVQLLS